MQQAQHSTPSRNLAILLGLIAVMLATASFAAGQRRYTIEKPKERSSSEPVRVKTTSKPAATRGILVVLMEPILPGQIIVKDAAGKELFKSDADKENGQAEFSLPRGKSYLIEASYPGYGSAKVKSRTLTSQTITRVRLSAQSAAVKLRDLPVNAQVLIDNQPRAKIDQTGAAIISGINPGTHKLKITHPEYNEFEDSFEVLEAGEEVSYPRLPLRRVAKLEITGPPGATILIDGAMQGKINPDGKVRIDYEMTQAGERRITVELIGYQTWTSRELLSPGPRAFNIVLDPVVTSAGVTDFFDALNQWKAPPSWKVISDPRNKRLEIRGAGLGILKDKNYRDLQASFTVWLSDGQGATWAVKTDPEGRNYYLFHLSGPSSKTVTPRRFFTYLVRDGGAPVEVGTPVPLLVDITAQASYTINVTVRDFTIQHSITSNETGETNDLGVWTDTSNTKEKFLFGSFGFRSLAGEVFLIDDFNLEPIKRP